MRKIISDQYRMILLSAAFMTVFLNGTFFQKLTSAFPLSSVGNVVFAAACGILLFLLLVLLMTLVAGKHTTKPVAIGMLVSAAAGSYFMSTYGIVIDNTMWQNVVETDSREAAGVMSVGLLLHLAVWGMLPSLLVWRWKCSFGTFRQELLAKLSMIGLVLAVAGVVFFSFSANFSSLFREYKPVRYYANPAYAIYSGAKYFSGLSAEVTYPENPEDVSADARIVHDDEDHHLHDDRPERELVILVVGESARADHFQLNGYVRETNPELSAMPDVVSFTNVTSCGTTTAVSVPCMFSPFTREDFDSKDIFTHENLLDVLKKEGVNVLWRDNNSSSKGVADRVDYQDFHRPKVNPVCDVECRDEGMLAGLQDYLDQHPTGDFLIVLHPMGSHGPEYYKRYPEHFEHFRPACRTNKLGDCSEEEIRNAYDNTLRYTDYFLSKVIGFLRKQNEHFEAGMLYISDHGESLGEDGIYLHGMPFAIAPEAQTHVAALVWTGKYFDASPESLHKNKHKPYSHDDLYCTVLGMFEVVTKDCSDPERNMIAREVK